MLQKRTGMIRFLTIVVTAIFMMVSILASTESVSAVSKLKVSVTKKTIYVGQTTKLKANKSVKWSVSKKKVVKLTNKKKKTVTVKGLKPGTVYVKAKAGKKTKKIKITVKARKAEGPKKINLATTADIIGVAEDCTVYVESVVPASQSSDVLFSSSDKDVAVVSPAGLVTGVSEGEVTITAASKVNKKIKASVKITVVAAKGGVLTARIDMTDETKYPSGKAVKAWFEVPVSDNNQRISVVDHEAKSATVETFINDSSGGKAYFLEWDENVAPKDRVATISFEVYRRSVLNSEELRSMEKGSIDTGDNELMAWCHETEYSGSLTEGITKELSDRIVNAAKAVSVHDKAHAIYLWICDNITRDKSMPNRELGDVVTILSSKEKVAGSCIDINSIFVALCNAQGIPARESFGFKIYDDPSKLGQNCRAEFYLPGYGWVEVDPAMPLGKVMNGTAEKGSAEWASIKETYWTSGSPDWICQNHGRDLTFETPAELNAEPGYMVNKDGTLNHFMFPIGEYDGQLIPGWGKYNAEFAYTYEFEEYKDLLDCGC